MFWIGTLIGAVLVGVVIWLAGKLKATGDPEPDKWIARAGPAVFAVLLVISTLWCSLHMVPAGHVGIVRTFRDITGQTGAGLVVTWPWQDVEAASVQIQAIKPSSQCSGGGLKECTDCFSRETQDVYVQPVVNLSVAPENVQWLYRNIPDYLNRKVRPLLDQILKDETVKYATVDIAPNREPIRTAVRDRLKTELAPFSITVEDLLLVNIDFHPDFKNAIVQKQIATQEALRQQELVAAAEATARQKAAEAEGNAAKLKIEAAGQAEANRSITASLTPELIQWQAVQKLAGNVQIALLPSGQGIIIDPTTLLKPAQ